MRHPLLDTFNMDDNNDLVNIDQEYSMEEVPTRAVDSTPPPDHKDDDDVAVEKKIDDVYDAAMEAYSNQTAYTEIIEPRYAARNAEVAANYLNIALQAATSRAKVKVDRKKANQAFVPYTGGKSTTNVIMANREDILKMITIDNEKKVI